MRLVHLFLSSSLILVPGFAVASGAGQETAPVGIAADLGDEQSEDEAAIVITGARTQLPQSALPLTVDVLGGQDFDDQVAVSGSVIEAVAARLPSFSPTREKLSGAGESLRGRSPLFAINGVPQSTPIRDGSRDGYTIDPFFIDRVEVIYGSNALQGIGATGGVVNQVTIRPSAQDGLSGLVTVQGTSADGLGGSTLGAKGAGIAHYRAGPLAASVGLSRERRGVFEDGEGRRIGVDGTQGEIQDSDSWSFFGRLAYQLSNTADLELVINRFELEGRGNYVVVPGDRLNGRPTTSERGDTEGAPPANRAELASVSLTERDLVGGVLKAQGFVSRTRDIFGGGVFGTFQDPAIDPTGQLFDQSVNKSRKLGGKLSYERTVPGFDAFTVIAGLDVLHDRTAQTLLETGRTWVPQSDFFSVAPFAQGNLRLMDGAVRLSGGVRFENVKLTVPDFTTLASYGSRFVEGGQPSFREVLKNGGIVVEPIEGLRAYASYAEGYTIADVGRILRGINTDGVQIDDYLALEPVTSDNREIGVEWSKGRIRASASYWWSSSDLGSLLVRNPDGIFDVVRQPIDIEGLDLAIDAQLPIRGLRVGGAYARTRGGTDTNSDGTIDTDLDGANISPDRVNLYAEFARGNFDARLSARMYLKRSFDGQPEANDFDGYTLVDAFTGYRLGKSRVTLAVQNLFDRQYITYNSDTQGPADNLRYFAGRGRTFTVGLTREF